MPPVRFWVTSLGVILLISSSLNMVAPAAMAALPMPIAAAVGAAITFTAFAGVRSFGIWRRWWRA
jgi:hypothetical protein